MLSTSYFFNQNNTTSSVQYPAKARTKIRTKTCEKPTISTSHTPILHDSVGDNPDNAFSGIKIPITRHLSSYGDFFNLAATSQPQKKLSQNVLLKTRLGSGQRPRKMRALSAA